MEEVWNITRITRTEHRDTKRTNAAGKTTRTHLHKVATTFNLQNRVSTKYNKPKHSKIKHVYKRPPQNALFAELLWNCSHGQVLKQKLWSCSEVGKKLHLLGMDFISGLREMVLRNNQKAKLAKTNFI